MIEHTQPTISVQEMFEFNQYLMALDKAGLSIALDFRKKRESLNDQLAWISTELVNYCKNGKSLEDALLENQNVPLQYRESLLAWWVGDRCPEAIAPLHAIGSNLQDSHHRIELAFLSPLLVSALGYLVLISLSLTFVKNLEEIYLDTTIVPGWGWRIMKAVRDWLPVWGIAVPVLLVAGWFWLRQSNSRFGLSFFKSRSREIVAAQNQNTSETLLILVGDRSPKVDGHPSTANQVTTSQAASLPTSSLIEWAQSEGSSYFQTTDALRFAASLHKDTMKRSARRWHGVFPAVIGAVLGGVVVLTLGLGLFSPLMELLSSISKP